VHHRAGGQPEPVFYSEHVELLRSATTILLLQQVFLDFGLRTRIFDGWAAFGRVESGQIHARSGGLPHHATIPIKYLLGNRLYGLEISRFSGTLIGIRLSGRTFFIHINDISSYA
jgi:hypothetical protein